jgi:hypothetical protein
VLAVVLLQVVLQQAKQQQIEQYGKVVMLPTTFIHTTWMRIWLSITANVSTKARIECFMLALVDLNPNYKNL